MKAQAYYNTAAEIESNICNNADELCVNCAGVVNKNYDIINKSKRNDYYLLYMAEGSMTLEITGKKMSISAGQLIIIKPDILYSYYADTGENVQYLWIHFSGKNAEETVLNFDLSFNTVMNVGIHQRLFDSWKRMFFELLKKDKYFNISSCCILKEIFITFSRYLNDRESKQHFWKSRFYIHEHFDSDISIRELAELENLGETRFRSEFKQSVGMTPKEYIIKLRIETACKLLTDSNASVSGAATLVGYQDAYYFSRIFKKKTGVSPKQYKNTKH